MILVNIMDLNEVFAIRLVRKRCQDRIDNTLRPFVLRSSITIKGNVNLKSAPFKISRIARIRSIGARLRTVLNLTGLRFRVLRRARIGTIRPQDTNDVDLNVLSFIVLRMQVLLCRFPRNGTIFLYLRISFAVILQGMRRIIISAVTIRIINMTRTMATKEVTKVRRVRIYTTGRTFISRKSMMTREDGRLVKGRVL